MVNKLAFKGLVVLSMGTVVVEPHIAVVVVSQHMEFAREMTRISFCFNSISIG